MSRWTELTARSLAGIETCKPVYRPTNFWSRGLRWLLKDLEERELEGFKQWASSSSWFYPLYGNGFVNATIQQTHEFARTVNDKADLPYMTSALNGMLEARRDFDVATVFWDQERWPCDLRTPGESKVGRPKQYYPVSGVADVGFGRPYLNYLLLLSALSHHVERPPRSVLEIGGGFGVLGEILLSRDPEARYVDIDIPPLLTIASYYLSELFGDEVTVFDEIADDGPVEVPRAAVLPSWRIEDVTGEFDAFVNAYSFQEMEPDVVEHYVSVVAAKGVRYVASLNSIAGKPVAPAPGEWGVLEPVTSDMIVSMFEARGYRSVGSYDRPLFTGAGRLAVLEKS